MKRLCLLLAVMTALTGALPALAEETAVGTEEAAAPAVEIASRGDFDRIRSDPSGSYVLTADIDLAGEAWVPLILAGGSFDGNGHTVSNVVLTAENAPVRTTLDGNKKSYESACVGFFGALDGGASVKNLTLRDVTADIAYTGELFLGGLAGFMDDAAVEGCAVTGTLKLVTRGKDAGISGLVGYGDGKIAGCAFEGTLTIGDEDEETPTEQFLGGMLACGHADINGCTVKMEALSAVWGYCHDGGLVGMFAVLKKNGFRRYRVTECAVEATIRFFEKGWSRRAYCKPFLGEQLHEKVSVSHNQKTFAKEELKTYPVGEIG